VKTAVVSDPVGEAAAHLGLDFRIDDPLVRSTCSVKATAGTPRRTAPAQLSSMDPRAASQDHSLCTWLSGGGTKTDGSGGTGGTLRSSQIGAWPLGCATPLLFVQLSYPAC